MEGVRNSLKMGEKETRGQERAYSKWNKVEETHVIAVVTFVSIPLSDWLAQAAVSLTVIRMIKDEKGLAFFKGLLL
jgi:hypothetical protein